MHTLLVLVGVACSTTLFAQVKVTTQINGDATTGKQLIQATATGGSGNYSYAWGLNTPGVVPPNNASEVLLVPAQDAEYIVFVRDKQTGVSAYSTILVKAPVVNEKHLLKIPGEDYKMKFQYSATGAVPDQRGNKWFRYDTRD
ncbi:hypothetical protein GO755_07780 [Spirosoma sp. HMF4905]|uniref:Uncharacterized protein n=1 Tax=Spirosoma arboris TaxID=2682092 RepID=A0A7K1S7Z5_9BACT|nr:hypothetical protein [Spirosoma arboris]MVM29927.1 hypothetical protein [Spirosoma arboris]